VSNAVVLLSGGLDSTVLLASVRRNHGYCYALSVDYGQRHRQELWSAFQVARYYGATDVTVSIPPHFLGGSSLTGGGGLLAGPPTVVPGRNLLFVALAVSLAQRHNCEVVYTAPTLDDRAVYPDCRREFFDHLTCATGYAYDVRIEAPFTGLTKRQVVAIGRELDVPLEMTWSCYDPRPVPPTPTSPESVKPCGVCGACVLRAAALA
jgi:7-cyano-7-deazaguanine synthase